MFPFFIDFNRASLILSTGFSMFLTKKCVMGRFFTAGWHFFEVIFKIRAQTADFAFAMMYSRALEKQSALWCAWQMNQRTYWKLSVEWKTLCWIKKMDGGFQQMNSSQTNCSILILRTSRERATGFHLNLRINANNIIVIVLCRIEFKIIILCASIGFFFLMNFNCQ